MCVGYVLLLSKAQSVHAYKNTCVSVHLSTCGRIVFVFACKSELTNTTLNLSSSSSSGGMGSFGGAAGFFLTVAVGVTPAVTPVTPLVEFSWPSVCSRGPATLPMTTCFRKSRKETLSNTQLQRFSYCKDQIELLSCRESLWSPFCSNHNSQRSRNTSLTGSSV